MSPISTRSRPNGTCSAVLVTLSSRWAVLRRSSVSWATLKNAAGSISPRRGTAHLQIRPDRKDLLALDQHVGLGKIADVRVHRHHGTATNDVAPAGLAAVARESSLACAGPQTESIATSSYFVCPQTAS